MTARYDVAAIGNAIVDVLASADEAFLQAEQLVKGSMQLIDAERAVQLYARMAPGVEASGGSAGNTVAGVASLGGRAAYLGKVAADQLGEVFAHDMRAGGVAFGVAPLRDGAPTARCLINVTPDAQRTMCTYLGASVAFGPDDVDADTVAGAEIVYLEGYLFDPEEARRAFEKAAGVARGAGRRIALTLSDSFVVDRHRDDLLSFMAGSVDVLFANEAEACALAQTDDVEAALHFVRDRTPLAAVTRGAAGSVLMQGGETVAVPAAPVAQLVDTTGAGDQYAAGVLLGLARGLPLEACGRLGSLAAAEVISHFGPRPQTPLKTLAEKDGLL